MRIMWSQVSISGNLAGIPGANSWLLGSQDGWGAECTQKDQSTMQVILDNSLLFCKLEICKLYLSPIALDETAQCSLEDSTLPFEPSILPCLGEHFGAACLTKIAQTCHFICCLLRWLLFKFALGKPFKKKLNADDYNVYTTLKLLICSSNNLGF